MKIITTIAGLFCGEGVCFLRIHQVFMVIESKSLHPQLTRKSHLPSPLLILSERSCHITIGFPLEVILVSKQRLSK